MFRNAYVLGNKKLKPKKLYAMQQSKKNLKINVLLRNVECNISLSGSTTTVSK